MERPNSKWDLVKDKLDLVAKWARDGLTEKQIYENLQIGKTAFYKYKKEKPELATALKEGMEPFILQLENALSKRALGFTHDEVKTYVKYDGDKEIKYKEITTKYYPPDVAACSILLKNKDKDANGKTKWSDNPAKLELDRQLYKLKKEVEELKLF